VLPYSSATVCFSDRVRLRLANLDQGIERNSSGAIALVLLLYFLRAICVSQQTDLFIDEILTYAHAQLPTLHSLWWTLTHAPAATDAPLHPFVSFLALRLPLSFPLSLRLPSILAYGAMMLSIFAFLRRRVRTSVALLATIIPMLIPLFQYAVQARPYSLVLGFSGWALVLWQRATEWHSHRLGTLIGLYFCITFTLLTHYYAGVIFVPLIAGELWRTARQGLDPAVWAVFAAASLAVLSYIPLLPALIPYRAHPWVGVVPEDLWDTYLLAFSPVLLIILGLCALLHLSRQKIVTRCPMDLPVYQQIALGALLLLPFFVFDSAKVITHSYVARYALPFSIAAAILLAIAIDALTHHIPGSASGIVLALLLCASIPIAQALIHPSRQNTGGIDKKPIPILNRFPNLPIAITNFYDFGRIYLFGPDQVKRRMVLVSDPFAITDLGISDSLANEAVKQALRVPAATSQTFLHLHPQFLLVGSYWLRDQALQQGRQIRFVGKLYNWDLYYVSSCESSLLPY
jgi:hypothetical protein